MNVEHISELLRLAREWATTGKDDLAHHALAVLEGAADEEQAGQECSECGEREKIEDTSTPAAPRVTCKRCGQSWNPMERENG